MVAERGVWPFVVAAAVGCGGAGPRTSDASALDGRFPVAPCDGATRPEAVGVWQDAPGDAAFVYDGCTARFVDHFTMEPPIFAGLRDVAGAFIVDMRDYAEPFPYFRAPTAWRGGELSAMSLLGERWLASWDGQRFSLRGHPYDRVERDEDLTEHARALLRVDRIVPTESELAAECGVPMPGPDGPEASYPERMLGPRGCEEYRRRAAE